MDPSTQAPFPRNSKTENELKDKIEKESVGKDSDDIMFKLPPSNKASLEESF